MRAARRGIAAFIVALALLVPATAGAGGQTVAVPIAEYASRVTEARAALEAAAPRIGDAATAAEAAARVRALVLDVKTVTVDGKPVALEHGTLTSLVVCLENARSQTTRREAAAAVLGNLRSEELALDSPGVAPAGDSAALQRIIAEESVGATFDARQWLQQTMQKLLQAVAAPDAKHTYTR